MLARLSLALGMLFSVSVQAAPTCAQLKELLLLYPDIKITSAVKPAEARVFFELGRDIILPIKNITVEASKGRIKVQIWSTKESYGSQVDILLPPEAFDPATGLLKPNFRKLVPVQGKYTAEFSFENGILTYKEFQDMVFEWDNVLGFRKTQTETEYRTVRMEVDETLSQFGTIEFTQRIVDSGKQDRLLNTVESAGPRTAEPVNYDF